MAGGKVIRVVPPDMIHRQAALSNEYRPRGNRYRFRVAFQPSPEPHLPPGEVAAAHRGTCCQRVGVGWQHPRVAPVPSKGAGSTQGAITGHGQGTLCLSGCWFPSLPPHSHGAGFFYTGFTRFCLQPHSASCTKLNVQLLFAAS